MHQALRKLPAQIAAIPAETAKGELGGVPVAVNARGHIWRHDDRERVWYCEIVTTPDQTVRPNPLAN
jgi:hypothetical protein